MNGPGLVCAGCGKPTTLFKPVCDICLSMTGDTELLAGRTCPDCGGSGLSGGHYEDGSPRECRPCRGDGYLEP